MRDTIIRRSISELQREGLRFSVDEVAKSLKNVLRRRDKADRAGRERQPAGERRRPAYGVLPFALYGAKGDFQQVCFERRNTLFG